MRDFINKSAEELDNPDQPFNEEEVKEWKQKLDLLLEKFEKLKEENKIHQAELNSLKTEVRNLKEQISRVPKKIWIKSAGYKILNIFEKVANSKIGEKAIEAGLKILLDQ